MSDERAVLIAGTIEWLRRNGESRWADQYEEQQVQRLKRQGSSRGQFRLPRLLMTARQRECPGRAIR